ncbi:hypothetical protein A3K73_06835 [Candidatus Pacearchaeota archaeon RBG_13_36_9]|nr:MAG: hypothetical protein A3K73_06835 [Candidatus Pacearchaeota archaeon RBG_13_36_9]
MIEMEQNRDIKYGEPQIEENTTQKVEGILSKIVNYEFIRNFESIPGGDTDKSTVQTHFIIKFSSATGDKLEQLVNFHGFVGNELVGQKVQFSEKVTEKTTYFDPRGREKDPSYRRGKKETETIQRLTPEDGRLPTYIYKETCLHSL